MDFKTSARSDKSPMKKVVSFRSFCSPANKRLDIFIKNYIWYLMAVNWMTLPCHVMGQRRPDRRTNGRSWDKTSISQNGLRSVRNLMVFTLYHILSYSLPKTCDSCVKTMWGDAIVCLANKYSMFHRSIK